MGPKSHKQLPKIQERVLFFVKGAPARQTDGIVSELFFTKIQKLKSENPECRTCQIQTGIVVL